MKKRLAYTSEGELTYCIASDENVGKGRCNHVAHQLSTESDQNFLDRVNRSTEIENLYGDAIDKIEQYDKLSFQNLPFHKANEKLSYDECKQIILGMQQRYGGAFGIERGDNSFNGCIKNIDQTFDGKDLYPSIEDKASMLLYSIVKDHPFVDGNKKIGSYLFIHYLYKNGRKDAMDPKCLAAVTLFVAKSAPKEKDSVINFIKSLLD